MNTSSPTSVLQAKTLGMPSIVSSVLKNEIAPRTNLLSNVGVANKSASITPSPVQPPSPTLSTNRRPLNLSASYSAGNGASQPPGNTFAPGSVVNVKTNNVVKTTPSIGSDEPSNASTGVTQPTPPTPNKANHTPEVSTYNSAPSNTSSNLYSNTTSFKGLLKNNTSNNKQNNTKNNTMQASNNRSGFSPLTNALSNASRAIFW